MPVRVTLLAAARSTSLLSERFGDDRPLDSSGWHQVRLAATALIPLGVAELRYHAPSPRCRDTSEALGYAALPQPGLSDCDMGRWRGHTLAEIAAYEAPEVDRWLADPRSAPHGGESMFGFISRIGHWLDTRPTAGEGRVLAVAEASAVRAALVYALGAPPSTYWNIDVRPLSTVTLTGHQGRWSLFLEHGGTGGAVAV
ncbi:histidine phosphatase family protein [Streptomyces sp. NA04227]|uniref:histidine phosphatase family protein n=1 Tax=Streptomyces sp. NA04227 TaxID=2742136 RepID=UPI001591AA72|nr:histidine phosphatase family protein [Streptomyces sp. NA04227]QKW05588.1 histidine phosphatase family protein [Streptomyces sp. NA04227]